MILRSLALVALVASLAAPSAALTLRALPWDHEIAGRKLAVGQGEKVQDLRDLHPSARSRPVSVNRSEERVHLVFKDRLDEEGNPLTRQIRIPGSVKTPLVLLLPDPKSKAGVRPLVIDDDRGSFAWGTIRLINVSKEDLAFRWEKKAKELKRGWKPVDVSPGGSTRNMEVFLYRKGDLAKPLYSAVWEHRDDMRQLVFVVPSTEASTGPYEFKFIPETRIESDEG